MINPNTRNKTMNITMYLYDSKENPIKEPDWYLGRITCWLHSTAQIKSSRKTFKLLTNGFTYVDTFEVIVVDEKRGNGIAKLINRETYNRPCNGFGY